MQKALLVAGIDLPKPDRFVHIVSDAAGKQS